ncbi:glycosyltransferase family 39 protein [Candidatus Sumerlaeota bacterium]|nr:glycosyltransferase family 39 protein [Candidatus Sumerlaeota bacterium]
MRDLLLKFQNFNQRWVEGFCALPAKIWPRKIRAVHFQLAVLLVLSAMQFYHLGLGDIKDWDEALYAWRAKIADYLGGEYWLDQTEYSFPGGIGWRYSPGDDPIGHHSFYSGVFPPLLIWLMGISFRIFGTANFAARLPSAILGVISIFAMYGAGRELGRNRWCGFFTAALYGSIYFLCMYFRKAQFDGPMISFMIFTIAAYAAWFRRRRIGWLALAGAMLGLGLMTKMVLPYFTAIFIGIAALYRVYALSGPRWQRMFSAGLLIGMCVLPVAKAPFELFLIAALGAALFINRAAALAYIAEMAIFNGVALLVAAPWHTYMTLKHGRLFWDWYVGYHLIMRAEGTLDGHQGRWFYYISKAWEHLPAPALGVMLAAAAFGVWRMFDGRREDPAIAMDTETPSNANNAAEPRGWKERLIAPAEWSEYGVSYVFGIAWTLTTMMIISASQTRRAPYILLVFPGYCMLTGIFLPDLFRRGRSIGWLAAAMIMAGFFAIFDRNKTLMALFEREVYLKVTGRTLLDRIWSGVEIAGPMLLASAGVFLALWLVFGNRSALRKILLTLIVVMTIVFTGKQYKKLIEMKDKHNFGWDQVDDFVQDFDSYDTLVFFGHYTEPSIMYYTNGMTGLEHNINIENKHFMHVNFDTHKDILAALDALPRNQRILLISDVGPAYLSQYPPEVIEGIHQRFRLISDPEARMTNGMRPNLEARFRDAQPESR